MIFTPVTLTPYLLPRNAGVIGGGFPAFIDMRQRGWFSSISLRFHSGSAALLLPLDLLVVIDLSPVELINTGLPLYGLLEAMFGA